MTDTAHADRRDQSSYRRAPQAGKGRSVKKGTPWPSPWNHGGRRISWRRSKLLISRRSLDGKSDAFDRQIRQGGFRYQHLPGRPTLEGETACKTPQGFTFGVETREADEVVSPLVGLVARGD